MIIQKNPRGIAEDVEEKIYGVEIEEVTISARGVGREKVHQKDMGGEHSPKEEEGGGRQNNDGKNNQNRDSMGRTPRGGVRSKSKRNKLRGKRRNSK